MLSNVTAKTKSALNVRSIQLILAAGIVLAAVFLASHTGGSRTLTLSTRQFKLETAVSEKEHEQGLSGRRSLADDAGMLFVFQHETEPCFWMKDMYFPIDIIWANAKREVVFIEKNVRPDTYPRSFCTGEPAAYVVELPAGTVDWASVRLGQVLNF